MSRNRSGHSEGELIDAIEGAESMKEFQEAFRDIDPEVVIEIHDNCDNDPCHCTPQFIKVGELAPRSKA